MRLEVWTLRETTNHEDEINRAAGVLGLLEELGDFVLDLLEQRVEEALHEAVWEFNSRGTLLN